MRTISMFQGFTDKVPYETNLEEVVNLIRTDASLRERTEKYRNLKQQGMAKAASGVKASLPVFAVAVRFAGGKQLKHIESFTGLVIVDIDHLPDGEADRLFPRICSLPRTFLAYRTVSGCGIRIIARYEWKGSQPLSKEQQVKFYQQVVFADVNRFFADLFGVSTDEKCKNVTRLSALAYDAEVCYRPDADRSLPVMTATSPRTSVPVTLTSKSSAPVRFLVSRDGRRRRKGRPIGRRWMTSQSEYVEAMK